MEDQGTLPEKYKRAKKRSKSIRTFYLKAVRYLIFSVLLLLFKDRIIAVIMNKGVEDPNILRWMEWNIMAVPLILMLILLVRGVKLFVFKSGFIKKWEQEKLDAFMKEEMNKEKSIGDGN